MFLTRLAYIQETTTNRSTPSHYFVLNTGSCCVTLPELALNLQQSVCFSAECAANPGSDFEVELLFNESLDMSVKRVEKTCSRKTDERMDMGFFKKELPKNLCLCLCAWACVHVCVYVEARSQSVSPSSVFNITTSIFFYFVFVCLFCFACLC